VRRDTEYCYRVRAFNAIYLSEYTSETCGIAPADGAALLSVALSQPTYRSFETLDMIVTAVGGVVQAPVDAYVMVQGAGTVLSLQLDGRLVPGIVPLARGIVLPSASVGFRFPLATAPNGAYTWITVVSAPGSLAPVVPLSTAPFAIVP
jgi:hypothetical protein